MIDAAGLDFHPPGDDNAGMRPLLQFQRKTPTPARLFNPAVTRADVPMAQAEMPAKPAPSSPKLPGLVHSQAIRVATARPVGLKELPHGIANIAAGEDEWGLTKGVQGCRFCGDLLQNLPGAADCQILKPVESEQEL